MPPLRSGGEASDRDRDGAAKRRREGAFPCFVRAYGSLKKNP